MFPSPATANDPQIDPTPIKERRVPNVSGPRWKMSFTKTGMYVRIGMLKKVIRNASVMRASIDPWSRRNLMPCFRLLKMEAVVTSGKNRAEIMDNEIMGARKDNAF